MTGTELEEYLKAEIAAFPCQTSLLVTDLRTGAALHAHQPEVRCVSASTIKVPILLCGLDQVMRGERSLFDMIPVPETCILPDTEVFERGVLEYSFWELLYWMIVESDNTATNRCIEILGFDAINAYAAGVLGMEQTVCHRCMLDWEAIQAGRNNYTSAADQGEMYARLYRGDILNPLLRETAMDLLCRQRCMDAFLRYIPEPIRVAHKTGGLDYLNHDAGIFYLAHRDLYLGIFTWEGPSPEGDTRQKQLIGRLAKAIYDCYK